MSKVIIYDNGDKYVGDIKNKEKHGIGTYTWKVYALIGPHLASFPCGAPMLCGPLWFGFFYIIMTGTCVVMSVPRVAYLPI